MPSLLPDALRVVEESDLLGALCLGAESEVTGGAKCFEVDALAKPPQRGIAVFWSLI